MTDKQHKYFYLRAWTQAFAANWQRDRGTLLRKEGRSGTRLDQVEDVAAERAWKRTSRVTAEDLRHACHVVAIGHDKSSLDLNNRELDKLVSLFRILTDPDDLNAQIALDNPEVEARRRLEWSVEHCGLDDAYMLHIVHSKFGTKNWRSLPDPQLRQLVVTLKNRHPSPKSPESHSSEEPAVTAPF